jgi:hypothetical protein
MSSHKSSNSNKEGVHSVFQIWLCKKMDKAYGMYGEEENCIQGFVGGNLR